MTHPEDQIMDQVLSLLTGLATTGSNATRGRIRPENPNELPAIGVYLGPDEPVEPEGGTSFQKLDSDLTVKVIAIVTGKEDQLDKKLSQIRREVTVALMADETLGLPFVIVTEEGRAEEPVVDGEGRTFVAYREMSWTVTYRRDRRNPS